MPWADEDPRGATGRAHTMTPPADTAAGATAAAASPPRDSTAPTNGTGSTTPGPDQRDVDPERPAPAARGAGGSGPAS